MAKTVKDKIIDENKSADKSSKVKSPKDKAIDENKSENKAVDSDFLATIDRLAAAREKGNEAECDNYEEEAEEMIKAETDARTKAKMQDILADSLDN